MAMLSEDRLNTRGMRSVYARIERPVEDSLAVKDAGDRENGHLGFSRENPHVVRTAKTVVVIPSANKWNCFNAIDRPRLAAVCTNIEDVIVSPELKKPAIMNTTTSVSPTASLEIKNLFTIDHKSKIPRADAPTCSSQVGKAAGSDLSRSNSGYRRLTLREKLAKQKAEIAGKAEPESPSPSNQATPPAETHSNNNRVTKATSLGSSSGSSTRQHQPTNRSNSVSIITEDRTIFGFKVLKGATATSSLTAGKKNEQSKTSGFTRAGSLRLPRQGQSGSNSRTRGVSELSLFYKPKTTSRSEEGSGEEPKEKSELRAKDKLDSFRDCSSRLHNANDSVEEDKKECESGKEDYTTDGLLKKDMTANCKGNSADKMENKSTDDSEDNKKGRTNEKGVSSDVADNVTVGGNGEHEKGHHGSKVQGKSESGKGRTGKLVIRAESLQEGRSRLEAFREKQRRGNLTRSFTHPDQEGGESSATSKGKNISESLAEIRERIRERRRRKEQFKRSKSLPETESQSYAGDRRKEDSLCSERVDRLETVSKEIEKEVEKDEEGTSRAERERWGDNSRVNVEEERETAGSEKASEKLEETEKKVKASSKMPARGSRLISSFRSERKDEARASDKNKEASSTNEDSTLENKKPTKRERRRLERYQRAKTMSAIMYNDIASSASRDMRHNNEGGRNDRNERGLAIPSVSEMKKRFMEAEGGSTRMSPPGLFYTTKTSGSSETSLKKGNSRDREQTGMEAREDSLSLSKNKEPHGEVRSEVTKPQIRTKTAVSRRHTVPLRTDFANNGTFISEATIVVNKGRDTSLTAGGKKNEINQTGSNLPRRRHTFSDNSSASNTVHNSLKKSQSVEKLRERFSQGGAIYANKWAPSSGHDIPTRKISSSESEKAEHKVSVEEEATRRRIKSDDGVARMRTELYIDTGAGKASLLTRRHTIGNRPRRFEKQSFEANKDERKPFFEKFLAKDSEVHKEPLSGERIKAVDEEGRVPPVSGLNKASESGTSKAGQGKDDIKERKKGKDDASASKLRNLFPGKPASLEKKTRLRERRARTIGGSLSPETVKKLEINSAEKSPTNKEVFREHVVKPDIYVADSSGKENTRDNKPERRLPSEQRCSVSETTESSEVGSRRGSDLNPDTYLSAEYEEGLPGTTISSSDDTAIDSVFHEAETPDDVASRRVDTKTRGDTITSDRSLPQDSFATEDKIKTRENTWEPQVVNDSGIAIKDQCLDQYLTTIKTLAGSPKSQRASLRGSPQKSKLNGTQTLKLALNDDEEDDLSAGQNKHLSVAKAGLSMHSWSTSDLDKISPHGDGREAHQAGSQVEISSTDFDEISHTTTRLHSLTEGRTKARPKRTKAKSMNPLKSLMERTDVRTNTEEPEEEETSKSGFEKPKKRSVPRKKRSQLEPWRRHTLDPVALAALASREDFSRVSLRKTKGPGKEKDEYSGSMPVMLLQIKGRKQVQTRLVEPKLSSLNSGDCFILVTPKELFCWIGSNANTIEKAKAVEISTKIQKRGDLCCKTGDVLYIDEAKQGNSLAYKKFCKILEGDTATPIEDPNLCPHDEFYEREMISTNKVYKLQEGDPPHLIPVTELCGQMPTIEVLSTKEVFIFDFGSELYLWTGQQSLSGKRKVAFHLAQMLYKQPFQCEAVVNPIEPRRTMKRSQSIGRVFRDAEGNERGRPTWTLFGRLHEKAETLLFQEKFFDWPDPTKIIKMKGHVSSGELPVRPPPVELKPCDPAEMLQPASALEPVMLESTNLGRGLGTPNVEVDGVVREGDLVTTLGMTVWLVTQNKHFLLPKRSEGHFHSGHGYVIRWVYFVAKNRTVKDKRGRVRPPTGRQRTAYFFWQGNECSVNEKGAAAIMAVELDEERGPQIRVVEGKEPPHFLKLFDGAMIIHSGKRTRLSDDLDEFSDKSAVRMYCVRNEDTSEGCLVQVRRSSSSLRSRSSFVVVDGEVGHIFVWHGCKANEYHRKTAERAANFIKDRRPIEISLYDETSVVVTEMEEGREPESFWKTVGGKKHGYVSLLKDPLNCDFSPRLYHMTSATGSFSASEILCPCRYPGRTCPFPVLQDDLYSSSQPACFILDVGDELFVWEGWMPAEVTKDKKGPAKRRWDEERKLTLKTALSYAEEAKNRVRKGVHVVQAGLEPVSFTTHFPFWEKRPQVTEIKIKEGKMDCEKKPAKDVLDTFAKKYYSFKELTGDNPPDGVDLSKLESYLDEDEFERIFEMSRELFNQLPGWKQDILKKAFGLF